MKSPVRALLAALTVTTIALGPAAAGTAETTESDPFYLKGAAYPESYLGRDLPTAETVKNLDRPRNDDPGLTLESGGSGRREFDDARYQDFVLPAPGYTVDGPATLELWIAPAGFTEGVTSTVLALLLDCNEFGFGCEEITRGSASTTSPAGSGFGRIEVSIPLDTHVLVADRTLKLRLLVETVDETAMWLAYDSLETPSALRLAGFIAPTTTTTTHPHTTTSAPSTTIPPATTAQPPATHPPTTHPPTTPSTSPPTTTVPPTTSAPPQTTTTTAPTTTTSSPPAIGRSDTPLDGFVRDLSYVAFDGQRPTGPRTAGLVLGWLPNAVTAVWPWLTLLTATVAGVLWRTTQRETPE